MRRTFGELRKTQLSKNLGFCVDDIPSVAAYVNQAQEELIYAAGETGFWGQWWRTRFNVTQAYPYITCPRTIARLAQASVCQTPVRIENQWYELMEESTGPLPGTCCDTYSQIILVDRGTTPTAFDVPSGDYYIRAYHTDSKDRMKRLLITGLDQNGNSIYTLDGTRTAEGTYLVFDDPFVTTDMLITSISGIQKDETFGDITLYAVSASTGSETFLARYGPYELVPSYRRYFINNLPANCCTSVVGTVQIEAMAKLEFIPAYRDTDFLIIGNIPALLAKCQSIRHSNIDSKEMKELSIVEHREAIRHLNNELRHYTGETKPAIQVSLFGTAKLTNQRIGAMM